MVWFAVLLSIIFVILCLIIILIVLMQPGQSEGLAGTFGSGGMLGSAFGVHMKNRLAKFTTILVILFFAIIFTFALAFKGKRQELQGDAESGQNQSIEPSPGPEDDTKPAEKAVPDKTQEDINKNSSEEKASEAEPEQK